jgi:alkylhydroperoxidase family enzyme
LAAEKRCIGKPDEGGHRRSSRAGTDMHTKDAEHAGETAQRLHLVAAWREAKVFTDAERAAPELTEQGTRIADAAGGGAGRDVGERRKMIEGLASPK